MTFRPALLAIPLAIVACADSATDAPAPVTASAEDSQNGTVCPQDLRLTLADYVDEGVPAAGDNFLNLNMNRDGVVVSDTGLQHRIIQEGLSDGVRPGLSDQVEVLYHGTLPDGTVFDSAYERGVPISFAPSQVIPGWTEALQDMEVCEARILYIPSDLAYGERGAGADIGPGADLVFYVQNLGVG